MAYSSSNRPTETATESQIYSNGNGVVFRDRVHWGAIISGLVVAISSQLLLSSLGAALGFSNIAGSEAPRTDSGGVAQAVGIWTIISVFISLFIGGWITARAAGSINKSTALLNGVILWATTLTISSWLLASGVSGTFGLVAANAGNIVNQVQQNGGSLPNVGANIPGIAGASPNVSPSPTPSLNAQQTRDVAGTGARASWGFTFGTLLGLAAAMIGAGLGARNEHYTHRDRVDV